jgi:CRP-like cAMP-binding protein
VNATDPLDTPAALQEVAQHPFLQGLNHQHLEVLAACAMRLEFKAGDVIFREGDPANRFYLIIDGAVALESHEQERHVTIQTIHAGDVLGWSWLFPPNYTHFAARAIKPTRAMFFYGTRLREMCEEDHDLGYEMLSRIARVVIHRLAATQKQLVGRAVSHCLA